MLIVLFFSFQDGQEAVDGVDTAAPALGHGVQVDLASRVAGYALLFLRRLRLALLPADAAQDPGSIAMQGCDQLVDLGGVKSNVYIIFRIV